MKNKYKILSVIISCLLAYLSYKNPVNDMAEIVPQIIIHAWMTSMYISVIIFFINEKDLLTSEEKEEIEKNLKESNSNLNYLIIFMFFSFVSLSAGNIIISVNYYSLKNISLLLFAVLFFASFSFSSVMCSNLFNKRDLKIQWIFSFTLIPVLSVFAISILAADLFEQIKMNHLYLMIFIFVLFFISFLSFFITKKEESTIKKPAT